MSALKKQINLVAREGFEYTTLGRVLNWTLSAGRVIVVATELIVIVAFLSRFWFDRQLTDLNNANAGKTAQIEASQSFEREFRQAQERLNGFAMQESTQTRIEEKLTEISQSIPNDVLSERIQITEGNINVAGRAFSEIGLATFINALENKSIFENINLASISPSQEDPRTLTFSIEGSVSNTSTEER